MRSLFARIFAIDPRSLAAFRIATGLLLLADLASRSGDLRAMYSDEGMFPRSLVSHLTTTIWNWSFLFGSGSTEFQAALFVLAGVFALALMIGFQTRISSIACWLLLVSLHHRVPPILSGADILLRMLLFWGMFLPLGQAWSLDRWLLNRNAPARNLQPILSIATAAILGQMAIMYLCSAYFKSNDQWFKGDVIAGSLLHDFYARGLGETMLRYPGILKTLTWSTLALEWAAPILLLLPIAMARTRMVLVIALMAMHLGIALLMDVGLFSFVAMAGLLLFLPPAFWESRWFRRLAPNSEPAEVPQRALYIPHPLAQAVCLAAALYMLALNINTMSKKPLLGGNLEKWKFMERGLGMGQRWGMFDTVPSNDGWYVAKATLSDGSEIDLLRDGKPVEYKRPARPLDIYPSHWWRKLFREMTYEDAMGYHLYREPVGSFLVRRWNETAPADKKVASFELLFCMGDQVPVIPGLPPRLNSQVLARINP